MATKTKTNKKEKNTSEQFKVKGEEVLTKIKG